ncbi:ABC-type sugar transport system, ATPase component [Rubellimicrobium thermophilum DSM 16684]|uniref:ABC-type sugar transport system, ATPase component n=1 Tax=Rubellimicrobium thermophilum DSM 16684 TaxID=1123069 RepID=S9RYS5_9RHOB|nr:ATP-binding cassette domain-containing protein [Rubellimicrobium thermophilum]EPX83160.1 ABC-type sugar transport system, ATPase component [Rubellimicrobium thermophilum DSM 16684]
MLGHDLAEAALRIPAPGAPILSLRGIALRPGARPFDLDLRAGEVVAVTGLVGAGKGALAAVLFGLARPASGRMTLDGRPYAPFSPREAMGQGVFLVPRDRRANVIVPAFDIARNLSLPFLRRHSRGPFVSRRSEAGMAARMVREMGIVCRGVRDSVLTLSGGNQQKVAVGRWMAEAARVLVLDEPFQGVDIQARRDIGARIRATTRDRATLVLVAEIDEAVEVADRILVLSDHALTGEHRNENLDLGLVMRQVTGIQQGHPA